MAQKSYWIKKRVNPQFDKPYYVACGQLSKWFATAEENSSYGYNYMMEFKNREEYEREISNLKGKGFMVVCLRKIGA